MIIKFRVIASLSLFILLLFSSSAALANQETKDSLIIQIKLLRKEGTTGTLTTTYVDLLNELAKKYRYRLPDSMKVLSEEAGIIADKINYPIGKTFALLRKGDYHSDSGHEKEAFDIYYAIKKEACDLDSPTLQVEVLKSIAIQEFFSQDLKKSILTYYEAIDLASENQLYEHEASLRHNLGWVYWNYKLHNEAHIEYVIADSLWEYVNNDKQKKAMTISNIALNAVDGGYLKMANEYNEKSIALLKQEDESLWLSRAYRVKSRYFIKLNDFEKAHFWINMSDSLLSSLYNPRDQMEIDLIHSNILTELKDLEMAKSYSLNTLKLATDFSDSLYMVKSYNLLEKIEELAGNNDSAYSYYKKSTALKKYIKKDDQVQNMAVLRTKMNFDKEKEALRLKNLEEHSKQQKYFQWIIAALLMTLIITFIVYQSNRREKKLNKQLETKTNTLISNEKHLTKINTDQKKLFSIVGHDLKGPIASLRELLKLMSNEENKEVLLESLLPKLTRYTDYVHYTIDNLLSWGQKQMTGEYTRPSIINIKEIAQRVIELFSEEILKKNLAVVVDIDENIRAWADNNDIEVVFRNLIHNAIKFSYNGGEIRLKAVSKEKYIVVEFTDVGVGMDQDSKTAIFELNQSFTTTGTNKEKGTGMGLILCKELLIRNQGNIGVQSIPKKGSTFYVYLLKVPEKETT